MKKSYKDYKKEFIGFSDYATLILVGVGENGIETGALHFIEDGDYYAYVVDGEAEIGSHYEEVFSCEGWLKVYSDFGKIRQFKGETIKVYRAGDYGCIIQVIG